MNAYSRAIVAIVVLATAACSDAVAPPEVGRITPPTAPAASEPSRPAPDPIVPPGATKRTMLVNSELLVPGPLPPDLSPLRTNVPVTWSSSNPTVATVATLETVGPMSYGKVSAHWPGTTVIEGTALGVTTRISVTVLVPAPPSTTSPVEVGFRMLELRNDAQYTSWTYAPELVLRDTTARGGVSIIAVGFSMPGRIRMNCYMLRAVGPAPRNVFEVIYGDFEVNFNYGARAGDGEAVAHITLQIPGPAWLKFDVRGPIVPGSPPPDESTTANKEPLSCAPADSP